MDVRPALRQDDSAVSFVERVPAAERAPQQGQIASPQAAGRSSEGTYQSQETSTLSAKGRQNEFARLEQCAVAPRCGLDHNERFVCARLSMSCLRGPHIVPKDLVASRVSLAALRLRLARVTEVA
jgi:hypothetical protein